MPISLHYDEPLFRPPAEAYSAILQVTLGCSWNRCAFCEMYTGKLFSVRPFSEVAADIGTLARLYRGVKKLFLADGNAFVLSTARLLPVLEAINTSLGGLQRISSYAMPRDILAKTVDELRLLREKGLKLLYIGIESGDDELLALTDKGETYATTAEGILRAHQAGIETSVMVITGLGGKQYSLQHARNSARLINEITPKFLSTLTLGLPYGLNHYQTRFKGGYHPQSATELAQELHNFLGEIKVTGTIFRSDHVSNRIVLKGVFPKDKERLLNEVAHSMSELVTKQI